MCGASFNEAETNASEAPEVRRKSFPFIIICENLTQHNLWHRFLISKSWKRKGNPKKVNRKKGRLMFFIHVASVTLFIKIVSAIDASKLLINLEQHGKNQFEISLVPNKVFSW